MVLSLLFPPKCTLCGKLLASRQTDLCCHCRTSIPRNISAKSNAQFIAHQAAIWYYKDEVRQSIHRFKFKNARGYADVYARELAQVILQSSFADSFDVITWVPISLFRFLERGYNQSALLAKALARELGCNAMPLLRKVRHTPPQSSIRTGAERRANIAGAFKILNPEAVKGRSILLVDDVYTTGSTASECAKTLSIYHCKKVYFASVAITKHD